LYFRYISAGWFVLVAKAIDGVFFRQQGFEDLLILVTQGVERLNGLTRTGSLALADRVQLNSILR